MDKTDDLNGETLDVSQQEDHDLTGESESEVQKWVEGSVVAKYTPIEFTDSVQMLYSTNKNFAEGSFELYKWQIEINKFLCYPNIFTKSNPLMFILCACNGSGKDAFVIAPFSVWHCVSKIRSRVIITSSSFNQLKNQTEPSIRSIAHAINDYVGEKIFIIKQFHIICKLTGSEILMFATDDPGLAEGYHPFSDYKDAEMAIITNESKTVKEEIFGALKRCNGYNRWMNISSPGHTGGFMYNMYKRSTHFPSRYVPKSTVWYARKVTAYECPHIPLVVIEDDKLTFGEHSSLFRSMYLAEFTSLEGQTVMTQDMIAKCYARSATQSEIDLPLSVGVDLGFSADGDESVMVLSKGNVIVDVVDFKLPDVVLIAERVAKQLDIWKSRYSDLQDDQVNIDDGNAGKGVIDILRRDGRLVNRVLNQSSAILKSHYANRGAELYFSVKRPVEEGIMKFDVTNPKHVKIASELASRYYKQSEVNGKLCLESKKEARANGHGSPNFADAYVLSHARHTIRDFVPDIDKTKVVAVSAFKRPDELVSWHKKQSPPKDGVSEDNVLNIEFKGSVTTLLNVGGRL